MKREKLIELLETYEPTQEEQTFKERMLSFIRKHADCFERSLEIGHITASAWLLNKDHSQALLMHHRKLDMWVQPGGHCDGDPDVLGVALKEAHEETGLVGIEPVSTDIFDIDIHLIPELKGVPAHYHYDVRFLLHCTTTNEFIQNHESKELKWFARHDQLPTNERSVLRMIEKWRDRYSVSVKASGDVVVGDS